ncbi:MAG: hypothetical protein KC431_28895 [Myxococcales bacterium]|nr:hypothetical protein [Myxococcales bacterium]
MRPSPQILLFSCSLALLLAACNDEPGGSDDDLGTEESGSDSSDSGSTEESGSDTGDGTPDLGEPPALSWEWLGPEGTSVSGLEVHEQRFAIVGVREGDGWLARFEAADGSMVDEFIVDNGHADSLRALTIAADGTIFAIRTVETGSAPLELCEDIDFFPDSCFYSSAWVGAFDSQLQPLWSTILDDGAALFGSGLDLAIDPLTGALAVLYVDDSQRVLWLDAASGLATGRSIDVDSPVVGMLFTDDGTLILAVGNGSFGSFRAYGVDDSLLWTQSLVPGSGIYAMDRRGDLIALHSGTAQLGIIDNGGEPLWIHDYQELVVGWDVAFHGAEGRIAGVGSRVASDGKFLEYARLERCDGGGENCSEQAWVFADDPEVEFIYSSLAACDDLDDGSLILGGNHYADGSHVWLGRTTP